MKKQFITVNGLNTHIAISGNEKRNNTLLLHGWGGDITTWNRNVDDLSKDLRIIAIDLPGFGLSERPKDNWTVSEFASFTAATLKKLNIEKVNIIGRSFGGRVAIKIASTFPTMVNKVVLLNSAGLPQRKLSYIPRRLLAHIGKRLFSVSPLSRWYSFMQKLIYRGRVRQGESSRMTVETFKLVVSEDLTEDLKKIKAETLIIAGSNDRIIPVRYLKRMNELIGNSKIIIINNAGHQTHKVMSSEFNDLVKEFLNE